MLKLINFSNYQCDQQLFGADERLLAGFLAEHGLDGVEMMFYDTGENYFVPNGLIKGVHLKFWSNWLDLWRGDAPALFREFGSEEGIRAYYGGLDREALANAYRENLRTAVAAGAQYAVFHVSHCRFAEVYTRRFSASDMEVIAASVELLNLVTDELPGGVAIMLENLWWPGMTLQRAECLNALLTGVRHPNKGVMLDVGHLMNTNPNLQSQAEGIEYVLTTISGLGQLAGAVRGIHLHYSLSGDYVRRARDVAPQTGFAEVMEHILNIDQHLPFSDPAVGRILEAVRPEYLVHEFLYRSLPELEANLRIQQGALGHLGRPCE